MGEDRSNMMESANWSDGVDTGASGPKNALSGVMHVGITTRVEAGVLRNLLAVCWYWNMGDRVIDGNGRYEASGI
ncbi:hypothetical protein ACOSP7_006521 [Xanthoceras sorbifolium]